MAGRRWTVAAIAMSAVLAGCGASTDPLSAEEFATEAAAICDRAGEEINALGFVTFEELLSVEADGTHQEIADYMEGVAEKVLAARSEIADLNPEESHQEAVDSFLVALTEWESVMSSYLEKLRSESPGSHQDLLEQGHAVESDIAFKAGVAGFPSCAQLQVP